MEPSDATDPLDYDAMTVACEELNYLRSLDLQPSRWVIGVKAWIQLVERCAFSSGPSDVETQVMLMGISVSVQSDINPWTVQLDCAKDNLQP